MRVPIIGVCGANSPETKPFPALDSSAHIVYIDNVDGVERKKWCIDKVTCMDMNAPDRNNGITFEMNEPIHSSWEVVCTEGRTTFWNPYSLGLFGNTPKEKRGKCSAGHMYFGQVGGMTAGYINPQTPFFAVSCMRQDGTLSNIMMFDNDLEKLRAVAQGVHASLTVFIRKNGGITEAADVGQRVVNWDDFPNLLWKDSSKDLRVITPVASLQKVANSRMGSN